MTRVFPSESPAPHSHNVSSSVVGSSQCQHAEDGVRGNVVKLTLILAIKVIVEFSFLIVLE